VNPAREARAYAPLSFWRRIQRLMPRRKWRSIRNLGTTEGGAMVFACVSK